MTKKDPYCRMSKAHLLAIIDPSMGIEEVLKLSRLSKQALIKRVRKAIQIEEELRQKPCPKGHKPDDPACDLMCYIVKVESYETHWWQRIPYSWGWWWRKPLAWFYNRRNK